MPPFNSFQFDGACYYLRWSTDCLLFCLRLCFFLYIFVALSRKISNSTKLGIVWIELKGEPLYSFFFLLNSFFFLLNECCSYWCRIQMSLVWAWDISDDSYTFTHTSRSITRTLFQNNYLHNSFLADKSNPIQSQISDALFSFIYEISPAIVHRFWKWSQLVCWSDHVSINQCS